MEIKTVKELKKHIGEFLVFEAKNAWKPYIWMEKLKWVGEPRESTWRVENNEVDCLPCRGLFVLEIHPTVRPYSGLYQKSIYDLYSTNAQNIIRTPTKEELKIYRDYWRKRVILGYK